MEPLVFGGSAHPALAEAVARAAGVAPARAVIERFPDGEQHVALYDSVRGRDVYLVQPTSPPAEAHLFELLLLADASRRAGAERVTAVVPYFGYARQDRRDRGREPLPVRLIADLLEAAGVERLIALDLHGAALEGCFGIPVEHRSAVPLLAELARPLVSPDTVIVSADLGAVKLAERYARILHRPVGLVHKTRQSGAEVHVHGVVGEVARRPVLLVDDMITTGGTIEGAVRALVAARCQQPLLVAATHLVLVGDARARLQRLPIARLLGTDSVATDDVAGLSLRASVAELLGDTISRLHQNRSIAELDAHA